MKKATTSSAGPWFVNRVYRPDAGGVLYAPVSIDDGREHGITPTYDREAMLRFVQQLNAKLAQRSAP